MSWCWPHRSGTWTNCCERPRLWFPTSLKRLTLSCSFLCWKMSFRVGWLWFSGEWGLCLWCGQLRCRTCQVSSRRIWARGDRWRWRRCRMFFKISLGGEAGTFFVEGAVGFVIGFAEEGLGEEGGVEILAEVGGRLSHWFYNFVNCIVTPILRRKSKLRYAIRFYLTNYIR